jgi:hypothetical protein
MDDRPFTAASLASTQEVATVQPKSRRAAWIQGFVLVAGAVALATVLVLRSQRPFDRDTLVIPVDELRSQAAEAGLLEQQMRQDHLAPAFVRFHAQQLGRDVGRTQDQLAHKPAPQPLAPLRTQALTLAADLQSRIDRLARDGALPRAGSLRFDTLAEALDALDHRIKPGG